jgi:hypothetical protein
LPGGLVTLLAWVASTGGCTSEDTHPPPAATGSFCENWTCPEQPKPIAAVAIEHGSTEDGGVCNDWWFSMPGGNEAFASIRACGGNQIRCGTADYRVSAAHLGTTITCAVTGSGPFRVRGHIARSSGEHFDVEGGLDGGRGTVTVSAGTSNEGGTVELEPGSCRVTDVEFIAPGSIWANFDCSVDLSTCATRGTFVFENCVREADGGSIPPP